MQTHPLTVLPSDPEPDRAWDLDHEETGGTITIELWVEPFAVRVTHNGQRPVRDQQLACSALACLVCELQDQIDDLEDTVELLQAEPS